MLNYHMNKEDREITDPKELTNIIKKGQYVTIAMCKNNEPYIVTLNYGYDQTNNILFFHSALRGLKIDIIKENPIVCATIIEDKGYLQGKCKHPYKSVVLWGTMEIIEDLEDKKYAMNILLKHLENDPEIIGKRLQNEKIYTGVNMLKLRITGIRGKSGN